MKQSQAHPVHEMMGGNVEATQRGVIAAEMVPMLAEEAKKRQGERTDLSEKGVDRRTCGPNGPEVVRGPSKEIAAKALGVGPTSVGRAVRAKKKHEMRAPLTKTQREFLVLLQKGYPLEVEKRGPGYVSHFSGAEIAGRPIRYDAAQNMINKLLVEKLSEDGCVTKYRISSTAVQLLASFREAHG